MEAIMNQSAYERGAALRRKVMGGPHVAKRGASPDRYTRQQIELVTEIAWGTIWSRPGLPLKTRSLVTLGMLTALDRPDEIRGHIVGALNNGATPDEIIEVFIHAAGYCGFPASNGAVRLAVEVFKERGILKDGR
jgi:4-carboxymuconolactone decarboxylase